MAEALALARAGDQAGHVGDDELHVARLGHAEVRDEGGERVVGDLRPGGGHGGDQRGLARVGEADEADVRDGLELEGELALLPRLALEREPGRLALLRGEGRVAEAAPAARRRDELGARAYQVGEHLAVRVEDDGAARHLDDLVVARGAVAVRALALDGRWPPCGPGAGGSRAGSRWTASTSRITLPPRPPLPPSGPPSGLNFSRWTEAQPCPPWPACTLSTAWSANSAMIGPLTLRTCRWPSRECSRHTPMAGRFSRPAVAVALRRCG